MTDEERRFWDLVDDWNAQYPDLAYAMRQTRALLDICEQVERLQALMRPQVVITTGTTTRTW